ncbi:MAG: GGDEF domain-containing protein [Burkholderiales bacterium]
MNSIDCQLEQYAKDFQVLVGLHRDLEQRYDHLSTSHRQLAGAGEVLRSMSPRAEVLCLVTNLQGDILQATLRARTIFEQPGQKMTNIQSVVSRFHALRMNAVLESLQTRSEQTPTHVDEVLLNPGNDVLNGHIYIASPLVTVDVAPGNVYWIIQELNKREQSEMASDPLSVSISARRIGAVVFDVAGRVVGTSIGLQDIVDPDDKSMGDIKLSMFQSTENASAPSSFDLLSEVRQTGQWQGEISSIANHRLVFRQWMTVSTIQDADGHVVAYAAQLVDREKMLMAERFLLDAHYHDAVTGLPNRKYFKEQAAKRVANARQAGQQLALLSIMLDRRQWIHDTHDTAVSDAVIKKMGERLLALARGCDILARADEDQFLLLLAGPHNDAELAIVATQMIKALSEPVTIQHQVLQIGGSIGCAMFPHDGADLPTLTKNAESTMRLARKAGGNRYGLFKHSAQLSRAAAPLPPSPSLLPPTERGGLDQCDIPTTNMELRV